MDLSQRLGRAPGPFRILPHLLPRLPERFGDFPLAFGRAPAGFRFFPLPLGPLTLGFGVPTGSVIHVHEALHLRGRRHTVGGAIDTLAGFG